jgi:hypothetical protein
MSGSLRARRYLVRRCWLDSSRPVGSAVQDNGSSVLTVGAAQNKSPAGGDGTTVIVDPDHANKWVGSYVDGAITRAPMAATCSLTTSARVVSDRLQSA